MSNKYCDTIILLPVLLSPQFYCANCRRFSTTYYCILCLNSTASSYYLKQDDEMPAATAAGEGAGPGAKKFRTPEGCKVCGVPCFYNYYRVRCCEGCKQFFRRAIRNLRDYRCQRRGGQCNIEKGDRCLGCRLDKCLLVGMNAYQIKRQLAGAAAQQDAAAVAANDRTEEFLQKMAERRQQLLTALGIKLEPEMEMDEEEEEPEDQHQVEETELCKSKEEQKEEESQHSPCSELLPLIGPSSVPALGQDDDFRILDSLMRAEQKQRWVFDLLTDVPPGWLDAFDSLEQLVQSPVSLLELADQSASQYKSDPRFDIENLTSKQDSDRINSGLGFINVDRTLLIDWAKTLPFFRQLEPEDQVTLVKHIAIQGATLCNSFYSATLGEETWTRTSGVKFINGFLSTPLANDKKLAQMHQRYLCDSVATIRQVDPSQEEFVLLLALLYCNSSAELSPAGRELLYTQSLKYTQMLMSLVQRRLGQMEGAKRFAECIFLLDVMGRMGHLFESMRSYQEMLYFRKMVRPVFPRALDAIM